ncbi:MAG: hypothetical protein HFG41_12280 [Coprococcus sp.]|nr:hypothetical protein [Coprococcus sp.]
MKKRLLCFGLVTLLALGSAMTVFAEDRQGASGWEVVFDGKSMDSNFTKGKMDDELYNMQPGDSVELTISLKNTYNGEADWYMKNQVLETLEKAGNKAEGGAYDYLLTYTDADGKESTLYASEKFGGDEKKNGEGLLAATQTLDDYFYLGRMSKGDTGTVKLKVALDGETLVGTYQNTLASLQMDFATELPTSRTTSLRPKSVRTGDQTNIVLYIVLSLVAGLVFLIVAILRLKRSREEEYVEAGAGRTAARRRRRRR